MPNIKERRDYILSFSWDILLLVLGGGFLSGFIDSIAGGGGLIALPVLLALQIPPHYAIGTNKFAATFGAAVSSYQFFKAGKVDMHLLYRLMPFTLGGAIIGCLFMLHLSAETLQPLVILSLIAAAVFVFTRRGLGQHSSYTGMTQKTFWQGAAFALVIGLYDGFIGPGTGTFLIIAFAMLGFDFVVAAGNAKILNLVSNITAFVLFIISGKVLYVYGLVMALGIFLGAFFGFRMAIRHGSGFVRFVMMAVTTVLIGKLLLEYIGVI